MNDLHFLIQQLYTSQDKTVIKQAVQLKVVIN